jgi:hypothetical protein
MSLQNSFNKALRDQFRTNVPEMEDTVAREEASCVTPDSGTGIHLSKNTTPLSGPGSLRTRFSPIVDLGHNQSSLTHFIHLFMLPVVLRNEGSRQQNVSTLQFLKQN